MARVVTRFFCLPLALHELINGDDLAHAGQEGGDGDGALKEGNTWLLSATVHAVKAVADAAFGMCCGRTVDVWTKNTKTNKHAHCYPFVC